NFLNDSGQPVSEWDEAERHTNQDVKSVAPVTPSTDYFDNPNEMAAEAMMFYRGGDRTRLSPALNDVIARFDRLEIDNYYGRNPDGSSRMMRRLDGVIVDNTPENRGAMP